MSVLFYYCSWWLVCFSVFISANTEIFCLVTVVVVAASAAASAAVVVA